MGSETKVECVADVRAELGEGPVWVAAERALYWVDINGRRIFRLSESGERREWPTPMLSSNSSAQLLCPGVMGLQAG